MGWVGGGGGQVWYVMGERWEWGVVFLGQRAAYGVSLWLGFGRVVFRSELGRVGLGWGWAGAGRGSRSPARLVARAPAGLLSRPPARQVSRTPARVVSRIPARLV